MNAMNYEKLRRLATEASKDDLKAPWSAFVEKSEAYRSASGPNVVLALLADLDALRAAIAKLHAAKGRYHTQLAACELFDAVGLKNERPVK